MVIDEKAVAYLALVVVGFVVMVYIVKRVVRFFDRLINGIRDGVKEAFRPERAQIAKEEYHRTTTSYTRYYNPPPEQGRIRQQSIPARREHPQGSFGYYQEPQRLPQPRVTVEEPLEDERYGWVYDPEYYESLRR